MAASVIRAHDLFGLRDAMAERMKDDEFKKSFGKRLRSLLNTTDKVAFYSNDLRLEMMTVPVAGGQKTCSRGNE